MRHDNTLARPYISWEKQPAVLEIDRPTDLYLSTLRRFVATAGGTFELRVELPGKGVMRLTDLGDLDRDRGPLKADGWIIAIRARVGGIRALSP